MDLFVRPSKDDGDSVAVREALSLGVAIVASDVVRRPDEVHLYPSGDTATLGDRLQECLRTEARSAASTKPGVDESRFRDFARRLLGLVEAS